MKLRFFMSLTGSDLIDLIELLHTQWWQLGQPTKSSTPQINDRCDKPFQGVHKLVRGGFEHSESCLSAQLFWLSAYSYHSLLPSPIFPTWPVTSEFSCLIRKATSVALSLPNEPVEGGEEDLKC